MNADTSDPGNTDSAYFEEAVGWDRDRLGEWRRSAQRAWMVAAAAGTCTLAACGALILLLPLKRVQPFVVRVDNSTGIVDVVPTYSGTTNLPETVTRFLLTHYVTVCERFNYATAESDYQECGAFHTAQRNQAWYALWNPANPASPLNVHRDGSEVSTEIESVSFFRRASGITDLAQVRYRKLESAGRDSPVRVTHWIATIQYAYAAPSKDARLRAWNPLGFKIVDFAAEPEVLGEPQSGAPASSREDTP